MSEDWSAVSKAINARVAELGWLQRELAQRSHVSQAVVREIQHHTVERRRSARTLEALSAALGWHPQHLQAVLSGRRPPEPTDPPSDTVWARLDALDERITEMRESLDELRADIRTVIELVRQAR